MKTILLRSKIILSFFFSILLCDKSFLSSNIRRRIYAYYCLTEFLKNDTLSIDLRDDHLNLFVLIYADDMVIFTDSVDELQKFLDCLYVYSYCQR